MQEKWYTYEMVKRVIELCSVSKTTNPKEFINDIHILLNSNRGMAVSEYVKSKP